MKTTLTMIGTAALALTLAACSPSIHGFGHSVSFQHGELVARAPDHPNAYISPDGSLKIGQRKVAVTPAQRALLRDYYDESKTLINQGEATGKAGAALGLRAIRDAVKGVFSGKSAANRKSLDAQARAITAAAQDMCVGVNHLHEIQREISAQVPAFKPYDATGGTRCVIPNSALATIAHRPQGSTRAPAPAATAQ